MSWRPIIIINQNNEKITVGFRLIEVQVCLTEMKIKIINDVDLECKFEWPWVKYLIGIKFVDGYFQTSGL